MADLMNIGAAIPEGPQEMTLQNYLEMTEEVIRKTYLTRLTELQIAPIENLRPLEDDLIDNVRLYHINEMVYQKGEPITEKFTTVFNTLSTYNASVFILMDSDGKKTDFYIGVRNNELDDDKKKSSVTLGETLKSTLIGHFPGVKIRNVNRAQIAAISGKIMERKNIASVSVVADHKTEKKNENDQFVQGLEKLALAMQGKKYTGIILAENQPPQMVEQLKQSYRNQYTRLSPLQKIQFSEGQTKSDSRSKSFFEMSGKQKAAMIGGAAISMAGVIGGAIAGAGAGVGSVGGAMLGGQITGQLNGFINSLAPSEQISRTTSASQSTTVENKTVTDLMQLLDDSIKRTKEFDSYGMWNVAGYFISDDMSAAEIAASNYRSLMNGENTGREVSAINSWRQIEFNGSGEFNNLTTYLSRFNHPRFIYGADDNYALTDASTWISGKELGIHLGLPRTSVSGLPVIKHAEFGKEVDTYQIFKKEETKRPEDWISLGRVFDLGKVSNKAVQLDNKSLNMHTFITGSTGSGKSNTVYQILNELHRDNIPFLVVEPAKGEYKDVFGNWEDVNVFSTNPNVAQLINLNPFRFPNEIHVLEHIDGLVEIFSVCWPMYDAMPAFFKEAILKSYESVGWDLGSSSFEGSELEYPDFNVLAEQLDALISESDYASDIKSNYRGALITRVKSLCVGLNKFIFTEEQTPYEQLFDQNCILDISRIKSTETKALIMGLMVYILNEYRIDQKTENNAGLKHVTVLEEAHNLLKNTKAGESELIGKSVEMLTQTIAEIRTYGEGFIIVDQSPSSVDIAAIKNTNTKIVLRTPEANDREAVGRSIGLSENQVNEIAKLPGGIAVVYQNNWVSPVLTMINKAAIKESKYTNTSTLKIRSVKASRSDIIRMLMEPWLGTEKIEKGQLVSSLRILELSRKERKIIGDLIEEYDLFNGHLQWDKKDLLILRDLLRNILELPENKIAEVPDSRHLKMIVSSRLKKMNLEAIEEICYIITLSDKWENDDEF